MTGRPAPRAGPTHVVCLADDVATLAQLANVLAAALPDAVIATATAATAPALDAGSCAVLAATLGAPTATDGARDTDGDGDGDALAAARRRAERMAHAGETALDLRHALSNPLAALLAEAQMLEMQALPGEPGQAAQRMVALCRRMITLVRTLDG
jgi:signal transduction histidine kinase